MASHLRCEQVSVRFGGVVACDNISLDIEEGKIVGLIGPNGAGKTTLFNVLSRFEDHATGEIYYRDKPVGKYKAHGMIDLGLARTFQNINLFGEQTTLANILIGSHHLLGSPLPSMLWLPGARRREKAQVENAIAIAELLHLESELDNPVKNLPYGYQKRVELARALAAKPEIILLDEPVAGCNEEETAELKDIIAKVNKELGITVFLVEHDMSMVMSVCDYLYVINFGANLAHGLPRDIQKNPDVITAYLGEDV